MRPFVTALALSTAAVAAIGCESDSSGPDTPQRHRHHADQRQLDHSSSSTSIWGPGSGDRRRPVDVERLGPCAPALRGAAQRRGGGTEGCRGIRPGQQLGRDAATRLAFTPENQQAAFEAVTTSQIPAAGSTVTETLTANALGAALVRIAGTGRERASGVEGPPNGGGRFRAGSHHRPDPVRLLATECGPL